MTLYWGAKRFEDALRPTKLPPGLEGDSAVVRRLRADLLIRLGRCEESIRELKSMKNVNGRIRRYDEFIRKPPREFIDEVY